MTNVEIVTELLREVPMVNRFEVYEDLKRQFGLTGDEMKLAFWKAEGRTDEEIARIKKELKRESESDELMKFISDLSSRNPSGNIPFGVPESNVVKIARLAQSVRGGMHLKEAFIEVFGVDTYETIVGSSR